MTRKKTSRSAKSIEKKRRIVRAVDDGATVAEVAKKESLTVGRVYAILKERHEVDRGFAYFELGMM